MTRRCLGLAAALAGCLLAGSASALADPPQITGTQPYGVPRGEPTDVTVTGSHLAGNPRWIAPFEVAIDPETPEPDDPARWTVTLTVGAEVPVGVYPIRVQTDDGLSNPILLAVGQVPQVTEQEPNNTLSEAQEVPIPVVVEGQAEGNDIDFFRFPGRKGQRIVIDAQCARIGSGVDPMVRLTTADGRFVASADDSPGLMTDARLTVELPEDTDYVIELSDSRYQGGGRPIYRLLVGPLPVAEEVYPLGGRRGETVGFELRGGTVPDRPVAAATLDAPADQTTVQPRITNHALGLASPSDPVLDLELAKPLAVGAGPELREPADPEAPPLRAVPPITFNGRIDPAGDEDRFILAVTPGQALRIRMEAADLGSALDGFLQVRSPDGNVLETGDDTNYPPPADGLGQIISPDPSLDFTVPEGLTELVLAVRDLGHRGGVGFAYRLIVEPAAPSFEVRLNDPQVSVPRGGTAAVGVTVERRGYDGPITLTLDDLPEGLTIRQGHIPAGQTVGSFTLSAAEDADFGAVALRVVGRGGDDANPIVRPVSKRIVFAQQGNLPTNLQPQIGLAAAPAQPTLVALDAPGDPIEVVHGFGASVPLQVTRAPEADAALTIAALPLSDGLSVAEATIEETATEGAATINAAADAPLGPVMVALTAQGTFQETERTFAVPAVRLEVVRPASLELATTELAVKAGESVMLQGTLARKGPFQEPVTIRVEDLPSGVSAEPVTVEPDASEFTLTLSAEADAAEATASANVVMALKINENDYATPPSPLAVQVVPAE